jgi:hypothetical protein
MGDHNLSVVFNCAATGRYFAFLLHTTMTHAAVMASTAAQISTRLKVDKFLRQANLNLKLFMA